MQVQQLPIYQFLEGTGKSFIIPVYQRDYAWTTANCQRLWEDLCKLKQTSRPDHFLGTIVTIGSGFQEYTVIDGQQRLTTISILLIALQRYLHRKTNKNQQEQILTEQLLDFLINKYSPEQDKRIRLKPNKQDRQQFERLFNNESLDQIESNIGSNFAYFYQEISRESIAPTELFDAFRKLKIVLIDLIRGQDDPQLIFESLNSTGVDLTAGDLIRNYILMDLEPQEQEVLYKKYWVEIENRTGNVAEFIRNYLIYWTKISVKRDDVYTNFKRFALEQFNNHKEQILQDLLYYANIYSWFVNITDHPNKIIDTQLQRLNNIEFTISHPYLLDVFNDAHESSLSEETIVKILAILESYAFRKILVDNTTQGLNKFFITLSKDIKKEPDWKAQYVNILSYILLEKRASLKIPTDEEFEIALTNKEVYRFQSKNRNFLLSSLENYESAYPVEIDELTIEHIMPQTLTSEWKQRLGDQWQDIHKKYLHTLGNLSLTAKNSELSNNSFETKQQIDYQISKLKLNYQLNDHSEWNEARIVQRAKNLAQDALRIWPYPQSTYTRIQAAEQIYDLTSQENFSGTKPTRLYLENIDSGIEVKYWRDVMILTCRFLYNHSPTIFTEIQHSPEFKAYFNQYKPLNNPLEFMPNKYIEGRMSATGIITFLNKLCERMAYSPESIQFSLIMQT